MKVKKRLNVFFVGLVFAALTGCEPTGSSHEASTPLPNILVAIADDWSWPHAGAYGDLVVQTPTFDRVASEGILFNHAYVSAPSCTSSRAALLTGQWHWRLRESANLWSTLSTEFPVYPDILEEAGYKVGFTRKGWGPGRVEVGGRSRNPAGDQFEDFEAFLESREEGQPFGFWFGSTDPHRPYEKGAGEAAGIPLEEIQVSPFFPDSPGVRGDLADYYFEVQRFDREVGEILERIEALGELDNTIVVVTSDNGMPFPRCKANLYDCGVRVPLAIRWPEGITGGRAIERFVSLTDLAPTFLEAAGQRVPEEMTGRSLLDLFAGNREAAIDEADRFIVFGKERHVPVQEAPDSGGTPMRAIRSREYLYIRNFRPDRWPAGTPNHEQSFIPGSWYGDVDNSPTKLHMIQQRYKDSNHGRLFELAFEKRPAEELYDLATDPGQLVNVAGDPQYASIKDSLSGELMRLLAESGDPRALGDADWLEAFPYYGGGGGRFPGKSPEDSSGN